MKGVLFMHGTQEQSGRAGRMAAGVLLGGLLALAAALLVLLLGALAVSRGILREGAGVQLTAGACLLGSFLGGWFSCAWWDSRRLFAGVLAGAACFLLILLAGLPGEDGPRLGVQALVELAACLCGGGAAGLLHPAGKGRGKPRKAGRRLQKGRRGRGGGASDP